MHNKYLIISSRVPITSSKVDLKDLKSRLRQFYLLEIKNPSDNLVYSLIMKFFSDNQVVIRKEIVENIVKKIDRSYLRIDDFLTKLNKLSIIKKKKIGIYNIGNNKYYRNIDVAKLICQNLNFNPKKFIINEYLFTF